MPADRPQHSLAALAERFGLGLHGDGAVVVDGVAGLSAAGDAAKALRILVAADISLARSAFGRTLAFTAVAIVASIGTIFATTSIRGCASATSCARLGSPTTRLLFGMRRSPEKLTPSFVTLTKFSPLPLLHVVLPSLASTTAAPSKRSVPARLS